LATRVEYDQVAPGYDRRYGRGGMPGIAGALRRATVAAGAQRALEVGCGTGHWLPAFGAQRVLGADRSLGMLGRAAAKGEPRGAGTSAPARPVLLAAEANALPFADGSFDLIACVNALHHFGDARRFLERTVTLLRPGGALVVIGLDPGTGRDRWYLYDYFPETLPLDLERYPAHAAMRRWMTGLGLERVTTRAAQRIEGVQRGEAVFQDPILHRYGTSQLTLLDDDAFERGMQRIRDAVDRGGDRTVFNTDLVLAVTRGFLPR
jgi:SAM-dependent methyltransferase